MKKVLVLCDMDAYANSVKPRQIKKFLEKYECEVELYSTTTLSRLGESHLKRLVPYPRLKYIILYFLEGLFAIVNKRQSSSFKKIVISLTLQPIIELRGALLADRLFGKGTDVLICENDLDEAVVMGKRVASVQILDLPAPLAEQAFYGGELTEKKFKKLKEFEIAAYAKADYISFHWHMYANFVKREKYNGKNFIDVGYGATLKEKTAHFSKDLKVVFLGFLGGYWTNLALLEKLSKIYPNIDVYGGPRISGLKVNFKGYAPTVDVLADYQFGLISITDDPLRKSSFSSKQLEYFSYGLPVLVPEWRKDSILDKGSIYFNTDNFVSVIHEYADESKWKEKSDAARNIIKSLDWEKVLDLFRVIINK